MAKRPVKLKRRRRLGPFHLVPDPGRRNNPQSLRKSLYDITRKRYDTDLFSAAAELRSLLRRRHGRTLHSAFSDEVLYNILTDKSHIKYYHLEAYARRLGIPVALMLFYSRLTANQQDSAPYENAALVHAFQRIMKDAADALTRNPNDPELYKINDLLRWVQIYEEESARSEQMVLFPTVDE